MADGFSYGQNWQQEDKTLKFMMIIRKLVYGWKKNKIAL